MNCEQCRINFVGYIEGLLVEPGKGAIESHLATCPPCRAELQQISSLCDRLMAGREIAAQNDFEEAVMHRISHEDLRTRRDIKLWRIIMKKRITKFAAVAAITIAVLIGVNMLKGTPAWAIGQTVKALENIQTLVITGTDSWGSESIPFKFWLRFPEDKKDSLDLRFESEKQIIVVQGTKAWAYWTEENVVKVYDNVTTSNGMMRDIAFWYRITEHNPWITGKVLATLKLFTKDWQENYSKCEKTDRDCVFVTCSYKPLSSSFWFVCDLESKLVVEGKYWRNSDRQGPPVSHAVSFQYNEKIDDKVFDYKIPEGAKVINRKEQKEADTLFAHGERLFKEKETDQAINIFQEVYEKYPNLNVAESALMMIGICYERLGQYEKAIATYQKSVKEYEYLKGWTFSTYYYLGRSYVKNGQKDKAVNAFQNCLIIGESIGGDVDKFPLKDARQYIEKLKSHR